MSLRDTIGKTISTELSEKLTKRTTSIDHEKVAKEYGYSSIYLYKIITRKRPVIEKVYPMFEELCKVAFSNADRHKNLAEKDKTFLGKLLGKKVEKH